MQTKGLKNPRGIQRVVIRMCTLRTHTRLGNSMLSNDCIMPHSNAYTLSDGLFHRVCACVCRCTGRHVNMLTHFLHKIFYSHRHKEYKLSVPHIILSRAAMFGLPNAVCMLMKLRCSVSAWWSIIGNTFLQHDRGWSFCGGSWTYTDTLRGAHLEKE